MTAVIARSTGLEVLAPLVPADVAELLAMYERCSAETTYRRWHGHLRAFPTAYLAALVADSDEHIAVVARREGPIVGFASAGEVAPGVREIGILVEDRWQRRGVGRALLTSIMTMSAELGTRVIQAEVRTEEAGLVGLLRTFGSTSVRTSYGVVTAQVVLRA
jgi:ribosomal protein S18 acetylase RimI-like enzyme